MQYPSRGVPTPRTRGSALFLWSVTRPFASSRRSRECAALVTLRALVARAGVSRDSIPTLARRVSSALLIGPPRCPSYLCVLFASRGVPGPHCPLVKYGAASSKEGGAFPRTLCAILITPCLDVAKLCSLDRVAAAVVPAGGCVGRIRSNDIKQKMNKKKSVPRGTARGRAAPSLRPARCAPEELVGSTESSSMHFAGTLSLPFAPARFRLFPPADLRVQQFMACCSRKARVPPLFAREL